MVSEDPAIRNRKPLPTDTTAGMPGVGGSTKRKIKSEVQSGISFLDVLRVISGIIVLSGVMSWFVTDGESLTWGYKPAALRWNNVKMMFRTPLNLTDAELARYDGKDPKLPIYVAVNGSVFDVTANPATYGPGGGYHFFSGRDAARAFVSGCFREDLTWDMRGLEEMYIKGAELETDLAEKAEIERLEAGGSMAGRARYLTRRREKRRVDAWEKVVKSIAHWDQFFRNHDKYFYVGIVTHPDISGEPIRELCQKQKKP
ncbi:uncharacterized protein H6S33_011999 [Morchella sextelata]|uniref:uncharacterized protein n=1 Tax=Morchella sextelata TaxID=1174677 RepID=UPI001D0598CE|nr:uncharacterized protein H6S33_011999 [Morchella sextelata]KAH0610472.1 hypothetical protein H6S33_011999 [Morchella sextelata]